jgi:hypothetical protein
LADVPILVLIASWLLFPVVATREIHTASGGFDACETIATSDAYPFRGLLQIRAQTGIGGGFGLVGSEDFGRGMNYLLLALPSLPIIFWKSWT